MDQYKLIRNLILQYLEENLTKLKDSQEEVVQEILRRLQQEGYRITPELEEYVSEVVSQNANLIKTLITRSAFLATQYLGIPQKTKEVLREIEKHEYPDGLNLSKRLWKRQNELKRQFKTVLFRNIRLGESAKKIAYEFQYKAERGPFEPLTEEELPKLVQRLRDTARGIIQGKEERAKWEKLIREYERYIRQRSKLGTYYAHRTLLRDLTKAVEKLSEKAVESAVRWWAYEKQLYYLNRIARTEVSNVIHLSILKETEKDPYIIGYRWELSPAHGRPDICDHLVSVDFGLGKGVWPKDKVPRRKPHPHCTCHITPIAGDPKNVKLKNKFLKEHIRKNPQVYEQWVYTRKWARDLYRKGVPLEEFFKNSPLRMKTREEMKEWEKKAELIKVLGENQKAGVKVGDEIEHPLYGIKTKVVAVYKDLLGNERVLTEHAKQHVEDEAKRDKKKWQRETRTWGLERIGEILESPQRVVYDNKRDAFILLRRHRNRWAGVVIGKEHPQYIYTVQPMSGKFNPKRYITLYERAAEE